MGSWDYNTTKRQRIFPNVSDAIDTSGCVRICLDNSLIPCALDELNKHLWNLRDSDKGKWMMANCKEIILDTEVDIANLSYRAVITGYVEPEAATDFKLRWT